MANINGTNLAAPVVPFTTEDTYPTHYAQYGKGGHRSVQSIINRDSIPTSLRELGMTVFVIDKGVTFKLIGGLTNTSWVENTSGTIQTISIDSEVVGASISNDGEGNLTFNFDYPFTIGGTTGFQTIDRIANNTIIQKPLRAGNNISISEIDSGATVGDPPIPLKYLEISSNSTNTLYNIYEIPHPSNSGTINIDLINTVFKTNIHSNYTLSINIPIQIQPLLVNKVYTFEFHFYMPIVSTITFPANIVWIGGSAPVFNSIANYRLVFRTENAGTTWLGNLAYTY